MQKQLRTVYQSIQKCLEGSGISLAVHIQDRLFKDPQTGSLKGCAIGVIPAWQGFFYNIEKSSKDPYPSGYESWLDFYDKQVIVELAKLQLSVCHDVEGHEYCASIGYGILCGKDRFVGGHILRGLLQNPGNPSDYVIHAEDDFYYCTQLSRKKHEVPTVLGTQEAAVYYMLPICSRHNNTNHYDVVMYTSQQEDVLELMMFGRKTMKKGSHLL